MAEQCNFVCTSSQQQAETIHVTRPNEVINPHTGLMECRVRGSRHNTSLQSGGGFYRRPSARYESCPNDLSRRIAAAQDEALALARKTLAGKISEAEPKAGSKRSSAAEKEIAQALKKEREVLKAAREALRRALQH